MRAVLFFFIVPAISGLRLHGHKYETHVPLYKFKHMPAMSEETFAQIPRWTEEIKGGRPTIWQRPKGEVKGVVLFMHGCGGYMADAFSKYGPDGYKLEACSIPAFPDGNGHQRGSAMKYGRCETKHQETLVRQKARARGYLYVSTQGKAAQKDKNGEYTIEAHCTGHMDVQAIQKSLEWVMETENVTDLPIIVAGFSSGGGAVPEVSTKVLGSCNIIVESSSHVGALPHSAIGFDTKFWDNPAPTLFINHKREGKMNKAIPENMAQLRKHSVITASIQNAAEMKKTHVNYLGLYMDAALDFCETGKVPEEVLVPPEEMDKSVD